MSLNYFKKKKIIIIFSDGSFLLSKNTILKRIVFFEKDYRNSNLWLKLNEYQKQLNKLSYRDKFLK